LTQSKQIILVTSHTYKMYITSQLSYHHALKKHELHGNFTELSYSSKLPLHDTSREFCSLRLSRSKADVT